MWFLPSTNRNEFTLSFISFVFQNSLFPISQKCSWPKPHKTGTHFDLENCTHTHARTHTHTHTQMHPKLRFMHNFFFFPSHFIFNFFYPVPFIELANATWICARNFLALRAHSKLPSEVNELTIFFLQICINRSVPQFEMSENSLFLNSFYLSFYFFVPVHISISYSTFFFSSFLFYCVKSKILPFY